MTDAQNMLALARETGEKWSKSRVEHYIRAARGKH